MRVLCAGDAFISPERFEQALRGEPDVGPLEFVHDTSAWPDEPFRDNAEIGEWVGDEAWIAELAADVEVIVTHIAPISARVIEAARSLRVIATPRGGPVSVNIAAASARGIPVLNLPGRNARAVAEYTVGVLICGPRKIIAGASALRGGDWAGRFYRYEETGPELAGQTIGLVGIGQVGTRVAELLRAFGVTVLAYDPYVDSDVFTERGVQRVVDLNTMLGRCDAISLHARVTDETRGMFGPDEFAAMRAGAYFVNSARGELVDETALAEALRSGRLSGAALDTYFPEPPAPDNPLLSMPNVIAVPHLAGASRQVAERAARRIAADVGRFLRGEPVQNCFNQDSL
ncbi:MAG TPA: 2-hydroxyacid dehydrogenase [Mycobacteriales bacterium]|nr:2-hydroxyacid dehydrogenase [Mycobacteriales bacterium]